MIFPEPTSWRWPPPVKRWTRRKALRIWSSWGVTTGGMLSTENYMKQGHRQPRFSPYHAAGSVAEVVAKECRCRGPVLTVSTACSSGAVGIKLALEILRRGVFRSVLVGGADALCRLTYYGFNSLQIVDRSGPHPMDRDRHGMSVAEGAAMLLLTAADQGAASGPSPKWLGAA